MKAVKKLFLKELEGTEGTFNYVPTIADKIGITRSVIVKCIEKFGVWWYYRAKNSLGMKGTYIRIHTKL